MPVLEIAGAGFAAVLLALVLTPLTRSAAYMTRAVRSPGGRHKHAHPTPLFGGAAVLFSIFAVVLLHPTLVITPQISGVLSGLLLILLLGIADDLFDLPWPVQLFGQLLAAGALLLGGIAIPTLHHPLGGVLQLSASPTLAAALLLFWVVVTMNAINWLDGSDGIATAVAIAALTTLAGISLTADVLQPPLAILAAAGAGACIGFLFWNRPPAGIFLGSSGSFGLGFLIAALSVLAGAKIATAAMVLLIPLADFVAVLIRRMRAGDSPMQGDRRHLHFMLHDRGFSGRKLFLLYGASALLLGLLGLMLPQPHKSMLFVLIFAGLLIVLLNVAPPAKKAEQ